MYCARRAAAPSISPRLDSFGRLDCACSLATQRMWWFVGRAGCSPCGGYATGGGAPHVERARYGANSNFELPSQRASGYLRRNHTDLERQGSGTGRRKPVQLGAAAIFALRGLGTCTDTPPCCNPLFRTSATRCSSAEKCRRANGVFSGKCRMASNVLPLRNQ